MSGCMKLSRKRKAESGPPKAHIHLGMQMRCEDLGAVGTARKCSSELLDGWDRAHCYVRVVAGVRALEMAQGVETTEIRLLRLTDEAPLGARFSNEATFASPNAICREASGRHFKPVLGAISLTRKRLQQRLR